MNTISATEKDKKMAEHCVTCPVCSHARKKQRGIAYWVCQEYREWCLPILRGV
jgi:hypothetical protein